MKVKANTLGELLNPLRQYFQREAFTREDVNENSPLRSELFSIEQLENHARALARSHHLSYQIAPEQLLKRLDDNEEILKRVLSLLQNAVRDKTPVMPAGEWLLDNYYLIEEQIRTGKRYLPKGYSKGLPKLRDGAYAGFPRVYNLAIEIISHSDGHVDMLRLTSFIKAYQEVSFLTLGELWAIPIMLRLALLENLRRVAARIGIDRIDADLAHYWADLIISTSEKNSKNLVLVIADMARSSPPMVSAFVAEFTRKLQWKGPNLTFVLNWVEQHLAETGYTINSMVLTENQKQAADQVSMSNSINSLRFLAKMDWREFVQSMSVVEQTLSQDPVYSGMDFYTRDHYRHQVELLAKQSRLPEHEVAQLVVRLANENLEKDPLNKREGHVGYYLLAEGRAVTERFVKLRLSIWKHFQLFLTRKKNSLYIFFSLLVTFLVAGGLFAKAWTDNVSIPLLISIGLLALAAASHFAAAMVNWVATLRIKPTPLPRMNFSKGIPGTSATLVVVPTILSSQEQAEKLISDLEVRFLSNRDPNLYFALLTDLKDSNQQTEAGDEELVHYTKDQIDHLNLRYSKNGEMNFLLFHRPRLWNPAEKIWMGYERKRGKLEDLNHLLKGGPEDRFSTIIGDRTIFSQIRYVITLDTDTLLPREAAWKLVGIMAHPLNIPVYDAVSRTVIKGYGIIQPRIAISLHGATRSLFTRMNENDAGVDPYTRVTSDVYQDIFQEGSFIGKGIYDVDTFEKVLRNRFPENRILSHDLLEGSHVRCGFASDVQFYEEYPSRYQEDINRRHRWIRGDWQIGNWFLPYVPDHSGRLHRNTISALSRWKIADNLRRSLVPVALVILQLLGWTVLPSGWFWTLTVIGIVILPSLLTSIWSGIHKPDESDFIQHLKNSIIATNRTLVQSLFTLICLPYEAFISIDAILKTLWRLWVSKKRLLEWNPSGNVKASKRKSLLSTYLRMWVSPLLFALVFIWLTYERPASLEMATPLLLLWFLAPAMVWWFSLPHPTDRTTLTNKQKIFLRLVARKTWYFFENIVGPDDNWLPPDNLQEYPIPVVAHRTSPTNMAIALLANLSAFDFGYATMTQMLDRTSRTLNTMANLERYLGHFYNWYDTQTLKILQPRYISTVDSGNLAGHLLTLRQGMLSMITQPVMDNKVFSGLLDTARLIAEEASANGSVSFTEMLAEFENIVANPPPDVVAMNAALQKLSTHTANWISGSPSEKPGTWTKVLQLQLAAVIEEFNYFSGELVTSNIPEKFRGLKMVSEIPTLEKLLKTDGEYQQELETARTFADSNDEKNWIEKAEQSLIPLRERAFERMRLIDKLCSYCSDFANLEYDFLYDRSLHLLAIGYSVDAHHRDGGYYDLLASEARLGLFVAIGQGKLPQESWFALGRRLATADGAPVLLSWSGTMFEYLMPLLVMPTYENTLLDETCRGVVQRQIDYGQQQKVVWGISESCYNTVDAGLNYQYKAFGVPGLGFKRGLGQDLVIAPYASLMSLMVDPAAACKNLELMSSKGFTSDYGFYEAIDYTVGRLPRGQSHVLIQTFMVHHQAMSMLSLAYLLLDQPMQKRFVADPQFQTALLLLQEQVPKATGFYSAASDEEEITHVSPNAEMRLIKTPDTVFPEVQLLSNGRYHVMVTNAGGGYSRWKDLAVTRWREDATRDNRGMFCYLRDLDTDETWSTSYQPVLKKPSGYEVIYSQGRVEFRRFDNEIETYTEIIVSPEDDIEIRRIHLTNHSSTLRNIDLTSFAEVVIDLPATDSSHPAFGNLFVETEILSPYQAILCTRRPRAHDEKPPFMFHLMKVNGTESQSMSYETDRSKFIGRDKTVMDPVALKNSTPLSGSQGSVLDPIVSIRSTVTLKSEETLSIDLITGIAETREVSQGLIDKYQDKHMRNRAFELSWTHSQVVLRQINATEADAQLYARLASSVVYTNPGLRANPDILDKNQKGQSGLWSYSISGDLPIVLLQISDTSNITLVKQLMQARAYWQLKGLQADLVVINEDHSSYRTLLQDEIQGLITAGITINNASKQGGVFVRSADQIPNEDYILLQTVARIIISDKRGTLADQVNKRFAPKTNIPRLAVTPYYPSRDKVAAPAGLEFDNGFGGFTPDGKEYVITTGPKRVTPLPWVNVIANPNFGTIISESGSSYTWAENAHEFRLTPWDNDAVSDTSGEALYLRDEETGQSWSPTPLPLKGKSPYITRHGFGYSVFEHSEDGIVSDVTMFVDAVACIKFIVLTVKNSSGRTRKLSVTGYVEWVLGSERSKSMMHVTTQVDADTQAIVARNAYSNDFASRAVFFDTDETVFSFTTDRNEFIGRNGSLQLPDAMSRVRLSGKSGAGWDPCAAIQVPFELGHGFEREIIFRMGSGKDLMETRDTIQRFRGSEAARRALDGVKKFWSNTLGSVKIATPDKALNFLANGWLLYQVMSCRLWGRSGFYQSGGAFGFRDQLQDVISLLHVSPQLTRDQILLSASRQFKEGDVQHWWHPPMGRGVRTLCSDDFLWLPFAASRYITSTGDTGIADVQVPFIEGRKLNAKEESYYDLPAISSGTASLYDHCKQAIRHAMHYGDHGLPLFGSGDWNDGMNLVGIQGKGESVWLAFFLYDVLKRFVPIAALRKDDAFVLECEQQAAQLRANINRNAWDGNWYLRAFFDNGSPLGSAKNIECSIDSISQSWSVLSGGGEPARSLSGMRAVDEKLVDRKNGLIKLLDPPFNRSDPDPGYIKGYLPGVRENGGQYTHAAIWMIMAFAKLGDRQKTWELLRMINPIHHGETEAGVTQYKAEPYVMAADVYGVSPHEGRGGWTWYTGSAGWTYQLIIEHVLGLRREGDKLMIHPCVPEEWSSFQIDYRYHDTVYHIEVDSLSAGAKSVILENGLEYDDGFIRLVDDHTVHNVTIKQRESVTIAGQ